ncbi:membrane protein insertion efficiency factor YidD [Bdellovibrio sp. HCB337]|uniref:membrane protein insertion efficiency factor YidD n=1 Tax=Bdellovibrio sp. HCB337 TaxID=3394358 RepID=UPI0039A50B82
MRFFESLPRASLLLFVGAYRTLGTTHMGGACRFTPSCSEYAVEAIKTHSFFSAIYLVTKRILKCRPGGTFGYDPVPACTCAGDTHARTK